MSIAALSLDASSLHRWARTWLKSEKRQEIPIRKFSPRKKLNLWRCQVRDDEVGGEGCMYSLWATFDVKLHHLWWVRVAFPLRVCVSAGFVSASAPGMKDVSEGICWKTPFHLQRIHQFHQWLLAAKFLAAQVYIALKIAIADMRA
jgi:hypothetical protein